MTNGQDEVDETAEAAIQAAVARLDLQANTFFWACSQHTGGLCVTGFVDLAAATAASDAHMEATGHTSYASSGECPF